MNKFLLFFVIFIGTQGLTAEENKIVLVMIVRNESKIIERCLDSALNIIDGLTICDTGSTDGTVKILENYIEKHQLKGNIHHHAWQNFGHNRTLAARAAEKDIKEWGYAPQNSYFLLLDADMLLKVTDNFRKGDLTQDHYLMQQKSSDLSYYNTRLIKASCHWLCVGCTHEYWTCHNSLTEEKITTLWIDDREDGGAKKDKFERDLRLLTQGIQEEPHNTRYMFYLAQTHKSLGNYLEAIDWYKKRISIKNWKEEVWYAQYMIGECYEALHQWESALYWYLEAYNYNPERAEPLKNIATYYRLHDQPELAFIFAEKGSHIPYPQNQSLFISHQVYDYQFEEELSIVSFYTSHKERGFEAINKLILHKQVPPQIRGQAYNNLLFYVQKLPNTEFIPIQFQLPLIREGSTQHYLPLNPTIIREANGYTVICRTVNYVQSNGNYIVLDYQDPERIVKTRNFLLRYDLDLNLISQQEIVDTLERPRWLRIVQGFEDCRLFAQGDALCFTCTSSETHASSHQISLVQLQADGSDREIGIQSLLPLNLNPERCEKNWLPFCKEGQVHLIYSYDPFIVYKPTDDGQCELVWKYEPSYDFSNFRGSAPPVAFKGGYLALVHEVVVVNNIRYYLHRWIFLDHNLYITKISSPFFFRNLGVEYCCGMTIESHEQHLLLTLGFEDREAFFCKVPLEEVWGSLQTLPRK